MNPAAAIIPIIEDDPPMRTFLRTGLSTQGFRVQEAETGRRGIQEARTQKPELIILDPGLPDMDGVDLIRKARGWSRTPIIVLSARGQETRKIEALDAGADDYPTKPFSLGELLARIRVALRNALRRDNPNPVMTFDRGRLSIDLGRRMVAVAGKTIHPTPIQYRLPVTPINNSAKVMNHRQPMKEVWGPSHSESAHYPRIYISQLRHELEADPAKPGLLLTESGVGYRLVGPDSAPTPEPRAVARSVHTRCRAGSGDPPYSDMCKGHVPAWPYGGKHCLCLCSETRHRRRVYSVSRPTRWLNST